jgi:hypothetical protein
MPYIGRPLNAGNLAVQSGTGDGSDTTPIATLDYSVGSSNSIGVYLDGVRQLAGTDFTASGTVLTFTTAPANGVGIDVYFLGLELSIPTPADASVTAAKLASNAVTTAKIIANAVDETKLKDALVADFTEVVVTASDSILLGDATDSGNTKRDTVQGLLDLVPAPTFGRVISAGGNITTTSTSLVDISGVSVTITTGAFPVAYGASQGSHVNAVGNGMNFNVDIDGSLQRGTVGEVFAQPVADHLVNSSFSGQSAALSAGSHTIKLQWSVGGNTGTLRMNSASPHMFYVREIR